jgi:hypothetical protein
MKNQKGFISIAVLIAVVIGLIVVGGGVYFVMHQQSSLQNNTETLSTNDQAPQTQNSVQATNAQSAQPAGNTKDTCPSTGASIAQGARTPAEGLAAFSDMLTLIAAGQGGSKAAINDSIAVSLQDLSVCQMQELVNTVGEGKDSVWAGSLLGVPSGAVSLTSSEKTSLIQVVEHSNDSLDASVILNKYNTTLSVADKQALQAVITNYGSPAHVATQSSTLSTYTNAQYGFSIQYPADLTTYNVASQSDSRLYPAFTTPNTPSTSLFVATDKTTGALFVVGISTDATQIADCLVAPKSDPAGGAQISNVGNVMLNGTTFLGYQSQAEALGFIINEHDYLVLRDNTCVAIREVPPTDQSLLISTLQGQSQLTAAQQTMLQQAQQAQAAASHVSAELSGMVQSFTFTN